MNFSELVFKLTLLTCYSLDFLEYHCVLMISVFVAVNESDHHYDYAINEIVFNSRQHYYQWQLTADQ